MRAGLGAGGPGREARIVVHSEPLIAVSWRSCCAVALTPTWCSRMARLPCTWQQEPSTRALCDASKS